MRFPLGRVVTTALATLAALGCSGAPETTPPPAKGTAARLAALGAVPCANGAAFRCFSLPVPLDHFGGPSGETIDIAFAVRPAPESTRRGTLITAVGGPGYAGNDILDDLSWASDRFAREFDIVYFDLRGVKASGHLECKDAAAAFYLGGLRVADAADERNLTDKAKAFATDCLAEMGIPASRAAFYDTAQAAEDLESFRAALGVDQLSLYGLSYGTEVMQAYAAAHGDRVRALLLDGTVDMTRGHLAYMTDLNRSIENLLDRTLADCASRPSCAVDYGTAPGKTALDRARAAYDAVAATLEAGPRTLSFPLEDGGVSTRIFSRADLDTTSFDALGYPGSRRNLLAALASAFKDDDDMPLLKLSYSSAGLNAQTAGRIGTAAADPGMSDAVYYTVTCNDYGADAPTPAASQSDYLATGRKLWKDPRILSPYYGDDPCAFWPVVRSAAHVPPASLAGVPTMVLDATGDGSVPFDQGEAVARRLEEGSLIVVDGGHHVMYGGGVACVDDAATRFLLDLERPRDATTHCADVFVAP